MKRRNNPIHEMQSLQNMPFTDLASELIVHENYY